MLDRHEQVGTWTCTLVASTHLNFAPTSVLSTAAGPPLATPATILSPYHYRSLIRSLPALRRRYCQLHPIGPREIDAKGRPHVGEGTAEAITNFPRLCPTACSLEEGAPLRRKLVKQPDATVPWTSQLLQHTYKAETYGWPRYGPCDPLHVRKHAHS